MRDYSIALEDLVSRRPSDFSRGSFGKISGGFTPDTFKTFNRGYTELYIDGTRGKWAAMDSAKSMGEEIGTVKSVARDGITVDFCKGGIILSNGDGFSFVAKDSTVTGFRGDVCSGNQIRCKTVPGIFVGARLFRNISAAFEKEIDRQPCVREISADVNISFTNTDGMWSVEAAATSEDGRRVSVLIEAGEQEASNRERMSEMFRSQIGKTAGHYRFSLVSLPAEGSMPFMSASALNSIRRSLAEALDRNACNKKEILRRDVNMIESMESCPQKNLSYKYNVSNRLSESVYRTTGAEEIEPAYEIGHQQSAELMRTRYCIRYELGICPRYHKAKDSGPLFLLNNGQRFALHFDCRNCEMTVTESQK